MDDEAISKRNLSSEEGIFNYRLSRSRSVFENALILAFRFQCLLSTLCQKPDTVTTIVMIYCFLHTLMRIRYTVAENAVLDKTYDNIVPSERKNALGMHDLGTNHEGGTKAVQKQRDYFKMYFNSQDGEVPLQNTIS